MAIIPPVLPLPGGGSPGDNAPSGTDQYFSPDLHNWVGYLEKADLERENKLIALGPFPPGMSGKFEGFLFTVLLIKLSQTPEGLKVLDTWGRAYLQNLGRIISGIAQSSSANVYNCLINQYVAIRLYQRMGLISAHDAVQSAAWVDHVMGEMLKAGYFKDTLQGLTTLVSATTMATTPTGESTSGLATLGRILPRP
jgi:hypothetical protein